MFFRVSLRRVTFRRVCVFHVFHVSHRRKGDFQAPKNKKNAETLKDREGDHPMAKIPRRCGKHTNVRNTREGEYLTSKRCAVSHSFSACAKREKRDCSLSSRTTCLLW